MNRMGLLIKRWEKSNLPVVFYHTTSVENALSILREQKLIANKGESICKAKNGLVSLSDRITRGTVEFLGNVVFEFDAVSLYRKNRSISPKYYGSPRNIRKLLYEVPLFENEWVVPKRLKLDLKDINEVLLITNKNLRESDFQVFVKALKRKRIKYTFLSERWLSDKDVTDVTSYILRIKGWKKFLKG